MPTGEVSPNHISENQLENVETLTNQAVLLAQAAFGLLAEHIGKPLSPEMAGRIATQFADLASSNTDTIIPELVGVGESATILGVSKQRVHQLSRGDSYPKPVQILKATPIWLAKDVRDYHERRKS